MSIQHQRASETRWLYRLENTALKYNRSANADRSIFYLRRMAERVWRREAPANRRLPDIYATDGLWDKGIQRYTSFCLGYTHIELARHHRTVLVLLHELTHALGPCHHNARFVKLYFDLLNKYAGFSRWFLQGLAAERNILIT